MFDFPEGIGPVECVNVEHEEVVLVPRWVDCERVTFKYGLGDEFIDVLRTLHMLGLDSTEPVRVQRRRGGAARRRRRRAAGPGDARRPDERHARARARWSRAPARTARRARSTCTTSSTTRRRWRRDGVQAVVWQTALNPVVALELLAAGVVVGRGRARPRGASRRAVPRPARRPRRPYALDERDPADPQRARARGRGPAGAPPPAARSCRACPRRPSPSSTVRPRGSTAPPRIDPRALSPCTSWANSSVSADATRLAAGSEAFCLPNSATSSAAAAAASAAGLRSFQAPGVDDASVRAATTSASACFASHCFTSAETAVARSLPVTFVSSPSA